MNKASISSRVSCFQSLTLFYICCLAGLLFLLGSTRVSGAQTQSTKVVVDVLFEADNSDITSETKDSLNRHAEALIYNPGAVVVLEGYSDSTGDDDYNLELSEKRAQSVKDYLVTLGVPSESISMVPKGGTDRFAQGSSQEALGSNRKVLIIYEIPETRLYEEVAVEAQTPPPEQPETIVEEPETGEVQTDIVSEAVSEPINTSKPIPPSPPPALLSAIRSDIRKTAPGAVIFDPPQNMQLERSYLIEAHVSGSFIRELASALKSRSGINNLRLGEDMLILLSGRGFDIQPFEDSYNSEELFSTDQGTQSESVSPADDTKWQWYIRPVKAGYQSLLLSVIIDIEEPEYDEINTEYTMYQKIIEVSPGFLRAAIASYWLTSFLVLLIIAIVSWVLLGKFNLI